MAIFNTDPRVIQAGSTILLCAAVFQLFDAMNVTFVGALRGAGDTHGIVWITVGLLVTVFAPLSIGAVAVRTWEMARDQYIRRERGETEGRRDVIRTVPLQVN